MENYRSYASGESYLTPGSVDAIRAEAKRIPERTWSYIAMFVFGGLAWTWTGNGAATMLFALIGCFFVLIYCRLERLHLQQQIQDEYTRAIAREVAAETNYEVERLHTSLEPLISERRDDYSDPSRYA